MTICLRRLCDKLTSRIDFVRRLKSYRRLKCKSDLTRANFYSSWFN